LAPAPEVWRAACPTIGYFAKYFQGVRARIVAPFQGINVRVTSYIPSTPNRPTIDLPSATTTQYIVLDMPHDSLLRNTSNSFNREECLKNGAEIPSLPLLAIRGHLCFRCFQPAERLMRCAGCNRGFYCSKECQKRDWEVAHKGLCKYLKKINEIETKESAKWRSWEEYRDSLVGTTSSF